MLLQGLRVMLVVCMLLKALPSRSLPVLWITVLREQKSLHCLPVSSRLQSGTIAHGVHAAAEQHDQHKESYQHLRCDTYYVTPTVGGTPGDI